MADASEKLAQLIEEARKRDKTLSGIVGRYPADWDEVLSYLDSMLGKIPEPLRPVGLLDLRKTVEAKKSQAQQAAGSTDGKVDWKYLMEAVKVYSATGTTAQQITLPASLKEGTQLADVYRAIAGGKTTIAELKAQFPDYAIDAIVSQLKIKKGLVERAGQGEVMIKAHAASAQTVPAETGLPPSLKEGTKEAEVYRAIANGTFVHSKDTHYVVYKLKQKGLVRGDGRRGSLRIKISQEPVQQVQQKDAGRTSRQEDSLAHRLLSYIGGMEGEKCLDEIAASFPGANVKTLDRLLYRFAKKGLIEYAGKKVRKPLQKAGAPAVTEYRGEDDKSRELQTGEGSALEKAIESVTGVAAATHEAVDVSELLVPYYSVLPELDRDLSEFEAAAEKLPETLRERLYRLVLEKVLPKNTDAVTDAHADAVLRLGRAFRSYSGNETDVERLIRHLESQAQLEPSQMEKYLDEFRARRPVEKPLPATAPTQGPPAPTIDLSNYRGLSDYMDDAIRGMETVINGTPGETRAMLEKLLHDMLPEDRAAIGTEHAMGMHMLVTALKDLAGEGRSLAPLVAYLGRTDKDLKEMQGHLNGFSNQQAGATASAEHRSAVTAEIDLSDDPYWGKRLQEGRVGEFLRESVPYILQSNSRLGGELQKFLGDDMQHPMYASNAFIIRQIANFMKKAEQERGSVPQVVIGGFSYLLRNPELHNYLSRFFRAVKNDKTVSGGIELLTGMNGKGSNAIERAIAKYPRAA